MTSHVREYYNCLQSGVKVIGGGENFEIQHRVDILRCAGVEMRLVAESNTVLARAGREDETTPADVAAIFETIRRIHIERGRDLDDQVKVRLAASAEYQRALEQERNRQASDGTGKAQGIKSVSAGGDVGAAAPYIVPEGLWDYYVCQSAARGVRVTVEGRPAVPSNPGDIGCVKTRAEAKQAALALLEMSDDGRTLREREIAVESQLGEVDAQTRTPSLEEAIRAIGSSDG